LADKLVEIAEQFKVLKASASSQPDDNPKAAALKADAQKAIDAGELAKADALLADVETEQKRDFDRLALKVAETSARRGEIALTRLRYSEAANHFANAAAVFPPGGANEDKRIGYFRRERDALFQQGDEFGDNRALSSAIERNRRLIDLQPRDRVPLDWATSQNNLGLALRTLGERESGTERLDEAIVAFRDALKERTRERVPLQWAETQNGLGFALIKRGLREIGTARAARFEEAVAAFRDVLREITLARGPRQWSTAQNNLGLALKALGGRESGTAKLEEAVAAFREALKGTTRERVPIAWAAIQNNLGAVLYTLGRRESGTAKLEEAVAAYREALKEHTRERVPLRWAINQSKLGNALRTLGEREIGTVHLEEAVAAYRDALKERTRERVPLQWARTQNNLGNALQALGEREGGTARLEEAVAAYTEAINADSKYAVAYNNRCWARVIVGQQLQQALADCNESLRILPNDADTLDSRGFAHLKLDQLDDAIVDFDVLAIIGQAAAVATHENPARGIQESNPTATVLAVGVRLATKPRPAPTQGARRPRNRDALRYRCSVVARPTP
jgi:tetratricopeptide (TPR) repeat protein